MKQFRYYFTVDGIRKEHLFSPIDWEKNTIASYKRSTDYFGVMRSLALPLDFVLDASNILQAALSKYGFEAVVLFEIERLDPKTLQYKNIYLSEVDLSLFEFSGDVFSAAMADFGPAESIKAKESTKYEYELLGADVVNVILPGVGFAEKASWVTPQQFPNIINDYLPALDIVLNDTAAGFLTVQTTDNEEDPNMATTGNWFARADRAIKVNLSGNLQGVAVRVPLSASTIFNIHLVNQSDSVVHTFGSVDAVSVGASPFRFDFNFDVNLAAGDRLFIVVRKTNGQSGGNQNFLTFYSDGELNLSYSNVSDPSSCKGIPAFSLYKRIMSKIIPGVKIQSDLLAKKWEKLIFTSGDGIREIEKAKIKITFKEFFACFQGLEDLGFGFENQTACFENRNYFFRDGQSMDLGIINDKQCKLTVASDMVFNLLNIGYEDGNTDETDGKQEYNSKQVWDLPITRIATDVSWISPVRADQYGIEQLRLEYNIKKSKSSNDTSSDNDNFMIDCYIDGDNYRPILGAGYQVTGVTSPDTKYNLNLSPKSNLMRHSGYLRSILNKLEGKFVEFASGTKNTELSKIIDGVKTTENENVPVSSFPDPYFMPYYATLTTDLPREVVDIIDGSPFNYIRWTWKNRTWKGYIIDISVDLAQNKQRELKLLLTQDNKL